jgi:membrane protein YdbS with pleckstrin-like domain
MLEAIGSQVLRVLKVPPQPAAPRERVRVFRASRNFFRYNVVRWTLTQLGALAGIVFGFAFLRALPGTVPDEAIRWIRIAEAAAAVIFVAQLPVTYAMLRLDFEQRWYVVGERSLRIREGIVTVREQTISYANIQNMAIRQGPLQQLLRIADLEVHTAGGGAAAGDGKNPRAAGRRMHVGTFHGVDDAGAIRDTIRARVRMYRDADLGDPDDSAVPAEAVGTESLEGVRLAAGRAVLEEVRALRKAFPAVA